MLKPVFAIVTIRLARILFSNNKIRLDEIRKWAYEAAPDTYGAGYAGGSLQKGPSQRFVEIILGQKESQILVTSTAYMNPKAGAVGRKEWFGTNIDDELKKAFGNNRRIRMDL